VQFSASAFPDGSESARIATAILASRETLHAAFLAQAGPAPTVLLDALADSLVDHCADAVAAGSDAALLDWSTGVCRARADVPAVSALFRGVQEALAQTFGDPRVAMLADRLEPLVRELRTAATTAVDTIDEIDLVLADMVLRIDANDPMTAEHCRAVSAWCGRIARRMKLSRAEATFVARGGLIHDVGKSTTPAEILLAPRALTDEEWYVMRDHVVAGDAIVRENHKLRDFGGVVRSHHERVDGRGYPDGLDRERIPIAVRIVTVADAFNAMIGRRSYRTPHSPDFATAELRRHAGTQFDPNVVEALIDVVSGGHERTLAGGVVA